MTSNRRSEPDIFICEECGSDDLSFDRSICACGSMHYFCGGCGRQDDECQYSILEGTLMDGLEDD